MELGACKRKTSTGGGLWKGQLEQPAQRREQTRRHDEKEKLPLSSLYRDQVPSESGFPRFTFVPSFGRLPTEVHVANTGTFNERVDGEPVEAKPQKISLHRTGEGAEDWVLGTQIKHGSGGFSTFSEGDHKLFQDKEHRRSRGKMEEDLFKAEFVFIVDSDEDKQVAEDNGYGHENPKTLDTSSSGSTGGESRRFLNMPSLPLHYEPSSSSSNQEKEPQTHKIKTSYKALAAIPTNTVLLEQKALDESTKTERTIEDEALDTHSEMCSPAQLRQQTEELCAAIDEVLQESRPMHRSNSSPSSLQTILESDPGRTSAASQRPGGRETKFANLYLSASSVTDSPKTKPGVIRPALVKAKIIVKEEEPVQPNPFKKYLEETSDSQTEEDPSFSHPFLHTKLNLPNKSPLHRQAISHADSLTASDILDNSYRLYDRSILYSKFCSARIKNKTDLPTYQEIKDLSKRKVADNGSPYNRSHCLARADLENISAKNN
uniref:Muscular LMNA interacting protein n=1 Tax=Salvator merianae TaxID=96440 RepID=A0A8D0BY41_SALMN